MLSNNKCLSKLSMQLKNKKLSRFVNILDKDLSGKDCKQTSFIFLLNS